MLNWKIIHKLWIVKILHRLHTRMYLKLNLPRYLTCVVAQKSWARAPSKIRWLIVTIFFTRKEIWIRDIVTSTNSVGILGGGFNLSPGPVLSSARYTGYSHNRRLIQSYVHLFSYRSSSNCIISLYCTVASLKRNPLSETALSLAFNFENDTGRFKRYLNGRAREQTSVLREQKMIAGNFREFSKE